MKVGDRLYPLVELALDQTARRQQVLSSNLANIDTPNYQAMDVEFVDEIKAAMQMTKTSPLHMSAPGMAGGARVYEVGGKMRDNGNSVDLDREMTEFSKNGLQYVTLVEYLNQKLKTLRSAINEGGKG